MRAIWESLDMTRTTALQNGLSYTHIGNPRTPTPGGRVPGVAREPEVR